MLSKPLNLDLLVLVFEDFEDFVVVEQVVDFATINLVHGNRYCEVSLIVLPVVNAALKQVLHGQVLQPLHRKCLP